MAEDAQETESLEDGMAALGATVKSAGKEVERLSFLLQYMDNTHKKQLEGVDNLVKEA